MKTALLLPLALTAVAAPAAIERRGDTFAVTSPAGTIAFRAADGAVLAVTPTGQPAVWSTGDDGLWRLRFADQTTLTAASPGVTCTAALSDDRLTFTWRAPAAEVVVEVTGHERGADLRASLTARTQPVLDLVLPGRLRFSPDSVRQLVCPASGGRSVGNAFQALFFREQSEDNPAGWQAKQVGPGGYVALFGGPLEQRADSTTPAELTVSPEAEGWLGASLAQQVRRAKAMVNRPSPRAQTDLVLADSADGPWFAGSHLGGRGWLWRFGGRVGDDEELLVRELTGAVVRRLIADRPNARIGLVALPNGPEAGAWAGVTVDAWRARLGQLPGVELVELTSPQAMVDAARTGDLLAILNPYGEWLPTPAGQTTTQVAQAIGAYVRGGGAWFETGGYPFHAELRPTRFLSFNLPYPGGFADYLQLDTAAGGSAAVYGVQQVGAPWDRQNLFVPGRLACGGDEQGGYAERSFGTYVAPGATWRSPVVRLVLGGDAIANLQRYAAENGLTRGLPAKMKPDVLEKFKRAVLVYYAGPAAEKTKYLHLLPQPTLIHFADYLKGGFDKEYPDHLPPHPNHGTPAEFRELFDRAREAGHLIMPYTNPTWWCDDPRGPTFLREGDAPLLRNLDGSLSPERYSSNTGFTITLWHPAVQAANRLTRRQFTEEYPVDLLFQDQCGARSWKYDANPASPTPAAYTAGMISMVDEDSAVVPLSTESGWDRMVNSQSQLCGLSWAIVPTEGGPEWRTFQRLEMPPGSYTIFPVAQAIAHDKCALLYHDLGQFVTTRRVVAWTLGLGFGFSYRCAASGLERPSVREWLRWLDRLQQVVAARYIGEPLRSFEHRLTTPPRRDREGSLRAAYGPVEVVANLDPEPLTEGGHQLAGYGFRATAPGVVAANLAGADAADPVGLQFVSEARGATTDVWVYARALQPVTVELPRPAAGAVQVTIDGQAVAATAAGSRLSFRLPQSREEALVTPPANLLALPPRRWPGGPPAVGVLDVPGLKPSWTAITPEQWVTALAATALPVRRITSATELTAALKAGVTRWLAIINPYGEAFPVESPDQAPAMLQQIADYLKNGGSWWETGGYSFYTAVSPTGNRSFGPAGLGSFAAPIGSGPVDAPPAALRVTPTGRQWLGEELAARVERLRSPVNRGVPTDAGGNAEVLVAGPEQGFIGGQRLGGWGWLWRLGGFNPNPDVALPVVAAAVRHLADTPPTVPVGLDRRLWHAVVTAP